MTKNSKKNLYKVNFIFLILVIFSFFLNSCNKNLKTDLPYNKLSESERVVLLREEKNRKNAMEMYKYNLYIQEQKNQAIKNFVNSLPVNERIAQLFILNISGNTESPRISSPAPGFYLLFSYNIGKTPSDVINYTNSIKQFFSNSNYIQPLLMIDHEGGIVNRLRGLASPLPSASAVAEKMSPETALELYYNAGLQLKYLGLHINLAPIIEVITPENKEFLDTRGFGDFNQTLDFASSAIIGFQKAGIGCVVKHFPGNTNDDPHYGLPIISIEKEKFDENYLQSFRSLFPLNPSGVLISHAIVSAIDPQNPSCFSPIVIQDILKKDLNYEGLVFSDDIYMEALVKNGFSPELSAKKAIEAGIDVIMVSVKRFDTLVNYLVQYAQTDQIFLERINQACFSVLKEKIKYGLISIVDNYDGGYTLDIKNDKILSSDEMLAGFSSAYQAGLSLYYTHNFKGTSYE